MNGNRSPKMGDIVLYKVGPNDKEPLTRNDILPAIIVKVWTNECVNLKVFCNNREDTWLTSILQGEDYYKWNWPQ